MSFHYLGHTVHAAVTQFDGVFVADFVQFMVCGEVLYQCEEFLSNVCLYMGTVWRVEPRDVFVSLVLLCQCFWSLGFCGLVLQFSSVARSLQCFLIFWFIFCFLT